MVVEMEKLVVILGPTCTGKTSLAVRLCQKFNGEIVSADSRQIYKYMDVGTGKLPVPESQNSNLKCQNYMSNVKTDGVTRGEGYWIINDVYIHLYDVVEPDRKFSVARFKDAATKEIESLWRRRKVPFLVGGTGFYIAAVLGETEFPRLAPDWPLRRELEKLSTAGLFAKLQKLDPERAKTIDPRNPRRLVRAIEIAINAPSGPRELHSINVPLADPSVADLLKIGLTAPREVLYQRADAWAEAVVNSGLLDEVQNLINRGYKEAPPMRGIIYQSALDYLDGKITKEEMRQKIKFDLHGYIRRQLTWFKRDKEIQWFDLTESDCGKKVEKMVGLFMKDG